MVSDKNVETAIEKMVAMIDKEMQVKILTPRNVNSSGIRSPKSVDLAMKF
jgi:hypothetical protein